MNKIILDNDDFTFDASTGVVLFSNKYTSIPLAHILLITNVTSNDIIYNFGCDGYGGTLDNVTLTLEQSTTAMSDTDALQIVIYVGADETITALLDASTMHTQQLDCLQSIIEKQEETNVLLKLIAE
jgi:hypothetical protein